MQQSANISARVALAELARVNLACKKIPAILELLRLVFEMGHFGIAVLSIV